jgi:hypothetical protein
MAANDVIRELLVRYLDLWTPTALRSAHGATFAMLWDGPADAELAAAAVGVFGEFADRMRSKRLTVLLIADDAAPLAAVSGTSEFDVHAVAGFANWPAAFKAGGQPALVYLDSEDVINFKTETIVKTVPGDWSAQRKRLDSPLTAGVDLVSTTRGEHATRIAFATKSAKSLEAFKDELWAVDEFAGVKLRDPRDPDGHLMDISLNPDPAALKGELLARLKVKPATVTELKHYALTETIYRAADAVRTIQALVKSRAVARTPEAGKLGGDVMLSIGG